MIFTAKLIGSVLTEREDASTLLQILGLEVKWK